MMPRSVALITEVASDVLGAFPADVLKR